MSVHSRHESGEQRSGRTDGRSEGKRQFHCIAVEQALIGQDAPSCCPDVPDPNSPFASTLTGQFVVWGVYAAVWKGTRMQDPDAIDIAGVAFERGAACLRDRDAGSCRECGSVFGLDPSVSPVRPSGRSDASPASIMWILSSGIERGRLPHRIPIPPSIGHMAIRFPPAMTTSLQDGELPVLFAGDRIAASIRSVAMSAGPSRTGQDLLSVLNKVSGPAGANRGSRRMPPDGEGAHSAICDAMGVGACP